MTVECKSFMVYDFLIGQLRIKHPQAFLMKKRNARLQKWDGYANFFNNDQRKDNAFSCKSGYLPRLAESMTARGVTYSVDEGERGVFEPIPYKHLVQGCTLDDLQVDACEVMLSSSRAALELETSSGKTEITANAAACVVDANPFDVVCVLVPRKNLLHQTVERLQNRLPGQKIGTLGDGTYDVEDARIVVAIPNTLAADPEVVSDPEYIREWAKTVTVLILDEAHQSTSNDIWFQAIDNTNARAVWALSGKLSFKFDKLAAMRTEGVFGKLSMKAGNPDRVCPVKVLTHDVGELNELNDEGLVGSLVDMTPVAFTTTKGVTGTGVWRGSDADGKYPSWFWYQKGGKWKLDKNKIGVYANEYSEEPLTGLDPDSMVYGTSYDIAVMEYEPVNRWVTALVKRIDAKGEACIVSCKRARHAKKLSRILHMNGVVHGIIAKSTGAQQMKVIKGVVEGKINIIVGVYQSVSEGVDIPRLKHFIKLDVVSNEQTLTQQRGRVRRKFEGKEVGYIHVPILRQLTALRMTSNAIVKRLTQLGCETALDLEVP